MMATVPHVTSGLGLRKFQADGFLSTRVHMDCYGATQNLPTKKRKFGLLCNHNTRAENAGREIKLHAFLIWVLNGNEWYASSSKLSS